MERTTIMLPEALRARLRQLAAQRGVSMATLIRESIDDMLDHERPVPKSLGIGASGRSDTARRSGNERPRPRPWR